MHRIDTMTPSLTDGPRPTTGRACGTGMFRHLGLRPGPKPYGVQLESPLRSRSLLSTLRGTGGMQPVRLLPSR